jgi:hypothetical protein
MIGAFAGMLFSMGFLWPRLPAPSIRCPFCSGQVPLIGSAGTFKPFKPVKQCPSCGRDLPA